MGDTSPLVVVRYTIDNLIEVMAQLSGTQRSVVAGKQHLAYFKTYFDQVGLGDRGTIVVEREYVDRHFLDDYAAFYLRCHKYGSLCGRLHFFRESFTDEQLYAAAMGQHAVLNEAKLNEAYVGCVVIKPLPKRFIGRTCLKTYHDCPAAHDPAKHRAYPCVRRYEIHLLGLTFKIDSLAFQEQDEVTAACATSALWFTFQQTGNLFRHAIPSPVSITQSVMSRWPQLAFPNHGLSSEQIAAAIRAVGLEPLIVQPRDEYELKAQVYAYLCAQIPCVLWSSLFDRNLRGKLVKSKSAKQNEAHAVAVTGYRADGTQRPLNRSTNDASLLLRSTRMSRLFVHDDRLGPFAALKFGCKPVGKMTAMESGWASAMPSGRGQVVFCPQMLVLPLYPKIRVPLDVIMGRVLLLDANHRAGTTRSKRLEWDIRLSQEGQFKNQLRVMTSIGSAKRREILARPLPRFLWRATAIDPTRDEPVVEIVYNATDVHDSDTLLVETLEHQSGSLNALGIVSARTSGVVAH